MDTTFVYNIPKITIPDTQEVVVTNMPEKVALTDDAISVFDSLQNQLLSSNAKMDSIYAFLQQRGIDGWGVGQLIAIIAIPLIIAIFAFTVPLLLNAMWKTEAIYQSRQISSMLSTSWQKKVYFVFIIISVATLLFWMFVPTLAGIITSALPYVTTGLVASAVLFYITVHNYNDPYEVLDHLESQYKREFRWTILRVKCTDCILRIRSFFDKNDKNAQEVWDLDISVNKHNPYYGVDKLYFMRVLALMRLAISKHDVHLFNFISLDEYTFISKIKLRSLNQDKAVPLYQLADPMFAFYGDAISLVGQSSEPYFQDSIIRSLCVIFNHSQLPTDSHYMDILKAIARLNGDNGQSFVRRYMKRVNNMYSTIPSIPMIAYIEGRSVEEKKELEKTYRDQWRWIRDIHYMLCAYWWDRSDGALASAFVPSKKRKSPTDILPVNSTEILYQYVCTYSDIEENWMRKWYTEQIFDVSIDDMHDLIVRYTAFMMNYTANGNDDAYVEPLNDLMQKHEKEAILALIDAAKRMSLDGALPVITKSETVMLSNETNGVYEQKLNPDLCIALINRLYHCEQYIKQPVVAGLFREETVVCDSEENLGEYVVIFNKEIFLQTAVEAKYVYNIVRYIEKDLFCRYVHAWFTSVGQMNVKEVSWKLAHFCRNLFNYMHGESKQYVVVSFDGTVDSFFHDYLEKIAYVPLTYGDVELFSKTKLYKECGETVFVIRKEDLPSQQYETGYDKATCSINDESSREEGMLSVRVNVNPHLVLRFNKSAKVLRIKCKR